MCRNGIELILNTKVKAVQRHSVTVSDTSGVERDIPFGACVWATGVAMHPVIKQARLLCCFYAPIQFLYFWVDSDRGCDSAVLRFGNALCHPAGKLSCLESSALAL